MASITLSVEFDELDNEELDKVEIKLQKLLNEHRKELPGTINDISEITREEDEDEESDD